MCAGAGGSSPCFREVYFVLPSFQHGLRPKLLISSAQHDKMGFALGNAGYKTKKPRRQVAPGGSENNKQQDIFTGTGAGIGQRGRSSDTPEQTDGHRNLLSVIFVLSVIAAHASGHVHYSQYFSGISGSIFAEQQPGNTYPAM